MTPPLTAAEAAALLRISLPTCYKLARAGKLPVAIERPLRIPREAVERLLSGEGWEPAETAPVPVVMQPTPIRRARPAESNGHDVTDFARRLYGTK